MNELMKIEVKNGKQLVDARELHSKLESGQEFAHWIKNKVVNNAFFAKNEDFVLLDNLNKQKGRGGHNRKDYALTLDTAKKVAMSEQTYKGNEVRDYFIAIEKKVLEQSPSYNIKDPIKRAEAWIEEQKKTLALEVALDSAKEWSSIKKQEKKHGKEFKWQLLKACSMAENYKIRKVFDQNYGTVNAYHYEVWMQVYGVNI